MLLFVELYAVTIISLLVCYVVGAGITRLFKVGYAERFLALFLSLVTGLTVIVSLYALVCTHGHTMQAAILALIIAVVWLLRNQSVSNHVVGALHVSVSRTGIAELPILIVLASGVLCLQYFILYDIDSEYLKTPFVDYVYYSHLSLPLNQLGLETNSLEILYPQFLTQQPYHYFEIWLNAVLVRVTGLPSVWVFCISSASVLLTIVIVGFGAVFAHFQLRNNWIWLLAILFLFVTGVKWPFLQRYDFVANGALLANTLLCLHPKSAPIYLFMLLAGLLLLNRHYVASGAALAILPLSFISIAPVVGIGTVVVAGYLFLTRRLSLAKTCAMALPIVVSTLYIVLFYVLHPEPYQFLRIGRAFALQAIIPNLGEAKTLFNIAVGVFINYAIYFAAYAILLLLIVCLRRQPKLLNEVPSVIWIWFGISLIAAAVMRAFGTHYLDSFQFFSNAMLPLTSVVLAILLAVSLQRASVGIYSLAASSLLLLIGVNLVLVSTGATRYSSKFMRQVAKVVPQMGGRGAYILAEADYGNAYTLSSDSYTTGDYVANFKNNYALMSLSELDMNSSTINRRFERDSAQAEQAVRASIIYRFAKFKPLKKQELSLDSIKYKFVTENSISFICASKEAKLPLILRSLVSVMYTDALSGQRLYLLDYKQKYANKSVYN